MHNAALTLTDNKRRLIDISPSAGLYAEDAAGIIIHDIPDALILKDMIYGGHIIWKETPNFIHGLLLTYTDNEVNRIATKPWANINLLAYLPSGLTNVKGALVLVDTTRYAHDGKVQVITSLRGEVRYSVKYNTLPGGYNNLRLVDNKSSGAETMQLKNSVQALIPVVYNNNIPYITWDIKMTYGNMVPGNFNYYLQAFLFLQGVLV